MRGNIAPLPGTVVRGPRPETCPACGQEYEQERSRKEHNTMFGVIKEAFDSWPEQFEFQPIADPTQGPRHLRGWLLVEVGHTLHGDVNLLSAIEEAGISMEKARTTLAPPMVAAMRRLLVEMGSDDTAALAMRMVRIPEGVRVIVPASIAKTGPKKIPKKKFEEVAQKVYALIETITGVSVDEYVNRARYGAP